MHTYKHIFQLAEKTLKFSKKMVKFIIDSIIFFKNFGVFLCREDYIAPHQVGHFFLSVHPYILIKKRW